MLPADLRDDLETELEREIDGASFFLRYNDTVKPSDDAWRDCAAVLARRDLDNLMRQGWGE